MPLSRRRDFELNNEKGWEATDGEIDDDDANKLGSDDDEDNNDGDDEDDNNGACNDNDEVLVRLVATYGRFAVRRTRLLTTGFVHTRIAEWLALMKKTAKKPATVN